MKHSSATKSKDRDVWVEGTVQEFLGLSDAEMAMIETRLAASQLLRTTREERKLTQQVAAARLKTSQSRLAKMEAGHSSVSLDLLVKSLFALGVSGMTIATIFTGGNKKLQKSERRRSCSPSAFVHT